LGHFTNPPLFCWRYWNWALDWNRSLYSSVSLHQVWGLLLICLFPHKPSCNSFMVCLVSLPERTKKVGQLLYQFAFLILLLNILGSKKRTYLFLWERFKCVRNAGVAWSSWYVANGAGCGSPLSLTTGEEQESSLTLSLHPSPSVYSGAKSMHMLVVKGKKSLHSLS
jgi:hypothetical protein